MNIHFVPPDMEGISGNIYRVSFIYRHGIPRSFYTYVIKKSKGRNNVFHCLALLRETKKYELLDKVGNSKLYAL